MPRFLVLDAEALGAVLDAHPVATYEGTLDSMLNRSLDTFHFGVMA